MDAHYDDNHQENNCQYAKQHKLVPPDPPHHRLDQFAAPSQVVPHSAQLLPVGHHPPRVVIQVALDVVADFQGLVHDPHSVLEFVGGIG